METIPTHSSDLIKVLDINYPDIFPIQELGKLSPYELGRKAGVIELIRLLKQLQQKGEP